MATLLCLLLYRRHYLGTDSSAFHGPSLPLQERWILPAISYVLLLGDSHLRATWSGFGQVIYGQQWTINMSQYHQPHLMCCDKNRTCVKRVGGYDFRVPPSGYVRGLLQKGGINCFLWIMTPLPTQMPLLQEYFSMSPVPDLTILNFGLHMLFHNWSHTQQHWALKRVAEEVDAVERRHKAAFSFHLVSWPEPLKWKKPPSTFDLPRIFQDYAALSTQQRTLFGVQNVTILDATALTRFSPFLANQSWDGTHYPALYGEILASLNLQAWLCGETAMSDIRILLSSETQGCH